MEDLAEHAKNDFEVWKAGFWVMLAGFPEMGKEEKYGFLVALVRACVFWFGKWNE